MATITKQGVASFTSYSETADQNQELVITAEYNGQTQTQTVPTNGQAGILYFDPSDLNFNFLTDLSQLQPGWLFVETILSVTP